MVVSIDCYRAAIGLFNGLKRVRIPSIYISNSLINSTIILGLIFSFSILLLLSGSVHPNPGPRQFSMSIAHLNVRSLSIADKFNEILAIASIHKFDLFAFSETWLHANIDNNSILIPGYSMPLRRDRHTSRGGGVALYVADYLWCSRRPDLECDSIEILWVELVAKNLKILCGVCYRPPNQSAQDVCEFFQYFQSMFDQIALENFFAIIMLGDFNAHYNFSILQLRTPTWVLNSLISLNVIIYLN